MTLLLHIWRIYDGMWRDACADDRPFTTFLARAQLICINGGFAFALLMLFAWADHFWRLHVR